MIEPDFYYRDSLDLKELFPCCHDFSLNANENKLVIEGSIVRLKDPESLAIPQLHTSFTYIDERGNRQKSALHIRSWREDGLKLQEVTPHSIKSSSIWERVQRKLLGKGFKSFLLTKNGVSYFSDGYHLYSQNAQGEKRRICNGPKINDPVFHEMIVEGQFGFIRSGHRIYYSRDSLKTWTIIYEGKRGIKDSMIWIEDEKALLFSEYTPGHDYCRHHIYKFFVATGEIRIMVTFYTNEEHRTKGKEPYCRHIHLIQRDSFTGDIYVGVGDSDDESAIYRSTDNGNSYVKVGSGNQNWRTLSLLFTKTHVLWNTDSGRAPQYLHVIRREQLEELPIRTENVKHYPLINSACWNSLFDENNDCFIMSASCEGRHYDKKNRVYAVKVEKGVPTVYCCFEDESRSNKRINIGDKLFLLGKGNNDILHFYDTRRRYYRQFVLQ